ncbi:MAG: hypothetical protein EOM90_13330 [Alphaproteobacteria bacterium]|nr:hypothetical protein [Alphaproteobacteria bacterium]
MNPFPFVSPSPFHLLFGIIKIVLIFSGLFFLLWYYLKQKNGQKPVGNEAGPTDSPTSEVTRVILPLRLQAFERFILFLERIHPSNLVMRLNNPDLTSVQLQSLLVRTIREEFEYNLSQQLYLSQQTWELVKNAKEEMVALINQATARAGDESMAEALVKNIFEMVIEKGKLPSEMALDQIKNELQALTR